MPVDLNEIAESINFDYSDDARAEFGPIDADEFWLQFADTQDGTNILIRVEQ